MQGNPPHREAEWTERLVECKTSFISSPWDLVLKGDNMGKK